MFSRAIEISEAVTALAILFGSALLGIALYLVAFKRLATRATKDTWLRDVIVAAVRHATVMWFAIAGAYAAAQVAPLTRDARQATNKTLLALLIVSITIVAARLASDAVKFAMLRTRAGAGSSILLNITRIVVSVIGLLILLQVLGIPITPLLTALGVGGLAVALAMQDTLSNLFGGLHVIASKQVRTGDFVRIEEGMEGYVVDVNWRTTAIRQLAGNTILVPNAKLAQAALINYYRPKRDLAVMVEVQVAYASDLDKVEEVTLDVAREVQRETPGAVRDFEPLMRFHSFADSGIGFTCILRAREYSDSFPVRHEFIKRLHRRYERESITIPFPTRRLLTEDGAAAGDGRKRPTKSR